jgi:glutamine---fructose-6-phosphate transaminase (isomerizing)
MDPMKPEVMINQVNDLPNLMKTETKKFDGIARTVLSNLEYTSLKRVYLTGDGDSFHASMAADLAFKNIAKIPCEPTSAMRFLEYVADFIPTSFPNDTLVVCISASGGTKRVAQSAERANKHSDNIVTLALTGNPEALVPQTTNRVFPLQLPDMGRSPGIRTYQASLLGLYLLAIRIGEIRNRYHQTEANQMRIELTQLAEVVEVTTQAIENKVQEVARAIKDAPYIVIAGSGPSYGTALFSAAKVVEAAGVFAVGQDLEEWAHVERFAYPLDTPLFIIAPPGRGYWRAADLAHTAKELGRKVIAVVQEGDEQVTQHADFVLPVIGEVREEFSPLVYHVWSNLFASHLADELGRMLFQSDNADVRRAMEANRMRER